MKKFYSMENTNSEAVINIYGDIAGSGEASAKNLSKQIDMLTGVEKIDVYINSYGGEVSEGLAIYNALKRHKAKVVTHCDGFAASIASVIFMAGDERIMNESSLLMIHNAWMSVEGNADQLRKQADDLDKITQASIIAYKANSTLTEEEIKNLMGKETWILPEEAIEYGFATSIEKNEKANTSQSARGLLFNMVKYYNELPENDDEEKPETEEPETQEPEAEEPATDEPESEPEAEPETPEDEPDETDGEDPEDENPEEPAQKLCGFFNALLIM